MIKSYYPTIALKAGEKVFDWQGNVALIIKERMEGLKYKFATIVDDKISVIADEIREDVYGNYYVKNPLIHNGYNRKEYRNIKYDGIYAIRIARCEND